MDVKPEYQGMSADEIALLQSDELDATGAPKEDELDRQRAAVVNTPVTAEGQEVEDELEEVSAAAAPTPAPAPTANAPAAETAPAAPAAAPEPAPAPPADAAAPEAEPATPRYNVGDPSKINEQLAALDARQAEAFAKLMEGEIDQEAYQKVQAEVKGQERRLVAQQTLHEANVQAEQAAQEKAITELAEAAIKPENGGIDYKTDAVAQRQFDIALNMAAADPANEKLSAAQLFAQAHKAVLSLRGKVPAPAPAPAASSAPTPAPAPVSRAVDKSQMPPTLSRVPPAADPSIAGDEFAHLGSLDGVELEKAFARMTPEQQERYLN